MRKVFALLPVLLFAVALVSMPNDAEARRFGSGASFGKQYRLPSTPRQPAGANSTPRQSQPQATAPRSGASRWLGPLAGLAAGGLLASLFFGDAFQGLQLFDLLLFAGLLYVGFRLLRGIGRRTAQPAGYAPAPQPHAYAGGVGTSPAPAPAPVGQGAAAEAPAWFDADSFIAGARGHFTDLQAAWDAGDLARIGEYTTFDMYAELESQRKQLGDGPQQTEVLELQVELLGTQRDGDKLVASLRFSGRIRDNGGEANDFAEIWHVIHAWDSPQGDWLIAGIQQL